MATAAPWKCGCGFVLGQVESGQLILYSEAVLGAGMGATPVVLTVIPDTVSVPIACTNCGRKRTWNGSADRLENLMTRQVQSGGA